MEKKWPIYLSHTVNGFIKTVLTHTMHSCSVHITPPHRINLLNFGKKKKKFTEKFVQGIEFK